ncbi:TlpA disulfide reductase family protein [Draconibacterium sp. IB214405]|uniref:peroxiredoxin family protein n=1 Tax=Draconibacterium sp. IB214405 TaxID=3097352 RepID=UPI002A0CB725|nr:TlpA disulfide reductase family protein [Draconibacterium sp. IB214405]MDX8339199.1 TlpA disulfide reductase family protein [Draconibacterium sp. IB214405]
MKKTALYILMGLLCSCAPKTDSVLKKGNWLFAFQIDEQNPDQKIPFNVEVLNEKHLLVTNADEQIDVQEITYKGDSVFIKMPVFGSEFKGKISGDKISGEYFNYNKSKVLPIPFEAEYGINDRFEITDENATVFSGKWKVNFGEEENGNPAIGIFEQDGNHITGTFQTETGDYRYLEGIVNKNTMQLSCFDGAHVFMFTAELSDSTLKGLFYSGNSYKTKWSAIKTTDAELADMKTLTYLNPGYDKLSFAFPNENGDTISLADEKYKGKAVIVQIFGTWCPNCMDETRFLAEVYEKYNAAGLEIIGLDFEIKPDFDYFQQRIERYRNDLNVSWELVLAGTSNKKKAAEALPMLNKIISYPTAIYIDKKGEIREIHTGFSGPGTGVAYEQYKTETEELIETLLNETI